ncbi:LuxR C-terminal-related transcriptional regulator [Patulibacter sp. NPDC049589]|uniref:helix-turn-helix transcriptional regulator n=1 Tax=Patulibacter sp. NPDC049589 TaxID=3154731 RepID=UPI003425D150
MREPTTQRLFTAVKAVLATAATHLDDPALPTPATLDAAEEALGRTVDAIIGALAAADAERRADLLRLLARVLRTEDRLHRTSVAAGSRQRAAVERGLEALRGCGSTDELVRSAAPIALAACQAERVVLSRVRDDVWSPWQVAAEAPAAATHRPGRRHPVALDDLPRERRVVRTASVVREVVGPDEHGCTVVVVTAPIVVDGAVLGILEAELAPAVVDRSTDAVVQRLGDALGRAFEVLAVRDRLAAQEDVAMRLRGALAPRAPSGPGPADELPTAAVGARPVTVVPAGAADRSALLSALTPRQRETLELMALGLSNAEIAERLVVGVPTVKSHVTAILRAAGALNRVEAIKRYLDGEPPSMGGADAPPP